ncbi:MAG: glutamate synthase large subunit [Bacteroidota bacterium]
MKNPKDDPLQGSVPAGLYSPQFEHDSCGIGFVAQLKGKASHQIVVDALKMLENMEHRGATGADSLTGDGAGILIQIPHRFYKEVMANQGVELPEPTQYGVGMVFFPKDHDLQIQCRAVLNASIIRMGFELLGYRKVPVRPDTIGTTASNVEPEAELVFVKPVREWSLEVLEKKLFILRKVASRLILRSVDQIGDEFYIPTFSYKTICYKGQLCTHQVKSYFPDLQDERVESAIALIHSRFSTNTFPQWRLAQPFRYLAHNGEINTIRGNINWMMAKEQLMENDFFTQEELDLILPICDPRKSDSRNLDGVVEMLVMSGRSLPHVLMMLIPEAWQENDTIQDPKRAFYEYHATLTEPWDGPASVCFTDGEIVGATLDRNGLRPSRYCVTKDDRIVMASEAGALPVNPANILRTGRLQPGKMFVANLAEGRIISDEELKNDICSRAPYREWLDKHKVHLKDLPEVPALDIDYEDSLVTRQQLFGVTKEELRVIVAPMASKGAEPIGSMGNDTPLAILSDQSQHFSNYFKQLFAQVSNPPIDPIRERMVMSLKTWIGGSRNILDETEESAKVITIDHPILTDEELAKLKGIKHPDFRSSTVDALIQKNETLEQALIRVCQAAGNAIKSGANILIMSDRAATHEFAPIPGLLLTGKIHHYLLRNKLRSDTALILETGDARETHHFATMLGYGALAINPYLAFESIRSLARAKLLLEDLSPEKAISYYIKAVNKGLLKIFSKMGISTLQSYHGAQIFEIVGLHKEVVDRCFSGGISRVSGLHFEDIAREIWARHDRAFPSNQLPNPRLEVGGVYQWKRKGEVHLFNPETIHLLQKSTQRNDYELFKAYSTRLNNQLKKAITFRSLFEFTNHQPIPLEEVEPVENILKRFATGAMSFGSISHEAHSTLAIAMNRIGAKSNSGEGGEDEIRFEKKANGDWERSAIKQVASGRFGVTSNYLTNAEELQIKIAQGAKPGEGGQLPGHKVDDWIGRVRYSTPGVGLISPPPHHDIYSIEDLAQLIFDLKNGNPSARISVKLVSAAGVGTIAAGVAKAHADHILIAGFDGGTGASPLSSIRHAGLPWELGLSEAHQTLVRNNLRSRVTLQVDGQIRTARDMAIGTLLGAEEWGVATAALVVEGCIMMRKCHLNTCPVGIATQNPELRQLFSGRVEDVVNFFTFLAQEMREIMAELGFRTINEMVGQVDRLKIRENVNHWKWKTLDLSPVLYKDPNSETVGTYKQIPQDHGIDEVLDREMIEVARPALHSQEPVSGEFSIKNVNRSVGAMLSHEISKRYGSKGLAKGTVRFHFSGSAGQSFGAFGAKGLRLELEGEANDYFGKGLSGAQLIVYPDKQATFTPHENTIIGNVAFYGATSGEAYIRGIAGERFCVRNSGVHAVVEGVGDHGCEYMTGGRVVILGETGRNFAAGMSGGIAYVYDEFSHFSYRVNRELVDLEALELEDIQLIRGMIEKHYAYTESKTALSLITDWENQMAKFVRVMPRDYKAILKQKKKESDNGVIKLRKAI